MDVSNNSQPYMCLRRLANARIGSLSDESVLLRFA